MLEPCSARVLKRPKPFRAVDPDHPSAVDQTPDFMPFLLSNSRFLSKAVRLLCAPIALLTVLLCDGMPLVAGDGPLSSESREARRQSVAHAPLDSSDAEQRVEEIRMQIARLGESRFAVREQATRQLMEQGATALPYLVEALGEASSEVRFRAHVLLVGHEEFELLSDHLLAALERPYGPSAREILRERAMWEIEAASGLKATDRLFEIWGTSSDRFRQQFVDRFAEAETPEQVRQAIGPVLGLATKSSCFDHAVAVLEQLSLPYGQQYSPGHVVVTTLARGLYENSDELILLATEYLNALEQLSQSLAEQGATRYALRRELTDRANMCQGAMAFLAQIVQLDSPQETVLTQHVQMTPRELQDSFCRGVAATEADRYRKGVSRVHIVDMMCEELAAWPKGDHGDVVDRLVVRLSQAAREGNKDKALPLLDALAGCRKLSDAGLVPTDGLGRQLAERLAAGAESAENIRRYHPTRSAFDRVLEIVRRGVLPGGTDFPNEWFVAYLKGDPSAVSDHQRLELERLVRRLQSVTTAGR